jgi:hypothetical protein
MVKNLLKKSSNGCKNGTNGSITSKNPWLGFYGTSIGQTVKKLGLFHFPPSSFAGTGSTERTLVHMNLEHAPNARYNLALGATAPTGANRRMVRAPRAPNRLALGHIVIRPRAKIERPNGFKTVPTSVWGPRKYLIHGLHSHGSWFQTPCIKIIIVPYLNIWLPTISAHKHYCNMFIYYIKHPRVFIWHKPLVYTIHIYNIWYFTPRTIIYSGHM